MNRRLLLVVSLIAVLLPMMLLGQATKSGTKSKGGDKKQASMSVTGCFNKGADANHYVLKNDKGKQYVVTGDAGMLSGHANNHNVTITGTMGKEKGKSVLKASDLKMNSMCK